MFGGGQGGRLLCPGRSVGAQMETSPVLLFFGVAKAGRCFQEGCGCWLACVGWREKKDCFELIEIFEQLAGGGGVA